MFQYVCGLVGCYILYRINNKEAIKNKKMKNDIKDKLNNFFKEKSINNIYGVTPAIISIDLISQGFIICVDISGICDFEYFSNYNSYLRSYFKALTIELTENRGIITINVFLNNFSEKYLTDSFISQYEPIWGYDIKDNLIYSNMLKTAHVGIIGASLSGKSYMVEAALNSLGDADIILLNTFEEDFTTIKANRIINEEAIEEYLKNVLENEKDRVNPLYITIDECNALSIRNKKIDTYIKKILAQGRHYNVFIIAIMQLGLKEDCSFRNLLNVRIAFGHKDFSMITNFLGLKEECLPVKRLEPREFLIFDRDIKHGKTFLITKKR